MFGDRIHADGNDDRSGRDADPFVDSLAVAVVDRHPVRSLKALSASRKAPEYSGELTLLGSGALADWCGPRISSRPSEVVVWLLAVRALVGALAMEGSGASALSAIGGHGVRERQQRPRCKARAGTIPGIAPLDCVIAQNGTIEHKWNLPALTERDAQANTVMAQARRSAADTLSGDLDAEAHWRSQRIPSWFSSTPRGARRTREQQTRASGARAARSAVRSWLKFAHSPERLGSPKARVCGWTTCAAYGEAFDRHL
jgi:hypothetical protein